MDGFVLVPLACLVVGLVWVTGGVALLVTRTRRRERGAGAQQIDGWVASGIIGAPAPATGEAAPRGEYAADRETYAHLRAGLWSEEPEVRRASVTALAKLAERCDWAIDGLIEALAEQRDAPARVAMHLDRLAPRADTRLEALLGHPEAVVRSYAAQLLSRRDSASLVHVLALRHDPSPRVRVAALQALQSTATISALRLALRLLEDPHPSVRQQACRTASAIAPNTAAEFVVRALKDDSWDVRDAAREALVRAGDGAVGPVIPLLEDEDAEVRSLAAMVLRDIGVVDELLADEARPALLDRALSAGGRRLRARVEGGGSESTPPRPVEAGL